MTHAWPSSKSSIKIFRHYACSRWKHSGLWNSSLRVRPRSQKKFFFFFNLRNCHRAPHEGQLGVFMSTREGRRGPQNNSESFHPDSPQTSEYVVKNISFHHVHCLGGWRADARRNRPIVAKFEHFKQKELVKNCGWEPVGTDFSFNDWFPKEILVQHKVLFPIQDKFIPGGSWLVITNIESGEKTMKILMLLFFLSHSKWFLGGCTTLFPLSPFTSLLVFFCTQHNLCYVSSATIYHINIWKSYSHTKNTHINIHNRHTQP